MSSTLVRVTGAEPQILAGVTAAAFVWRWPDAGFVEAISLSTSTQVLADRAGLELRIYRKLEDVVLEADEVASFLPALLLCGADPSAAGWSKVLIEVKALEEWTLQLRNTTAGAINPRLWFDFRPMSEGGDE